MDEQRKELERRLLYDIKVPPLREALRETMLADIRWMCGGFWHTDNAIQFVAALVWWRVLGFLEPEAAHFLFDLILIAVGCVLPFSPRRIPAAMTACCGLVTALMLVCWLYPEWVQ